jgi:hypothetical protein
MIYKNIILLYMRYYIKNFHGGSDIKDVNLIGLVYDPVNQDTNVSKYLNNPKSLIIYNENWDQYMDKESISAGGGNGFLRQYRSDVDDSQKENVEKNRNTDSVNAFIYGIPTGSNQNDNNLSNSSGTEMSYSGILDNALNQIFGCIENKDIENVIWSIDIEGNIGYGIFQKNQAIIDFLNEYFKNEFKTRYYISSKEVKNHGSNIINDQNMLAKVRGEQTTTTKTASVTISSTKETVLELICKHIK